MAFFGKKKHRDEFEDDYLLSDNEGGFVINFDGENNNLFDGSHKAPHAITVSEVLGEAAHRETEEKETPQTPAFNIPMESRGSGEYSSAARALMQRMKKAKQTVEDISDDGLENNSVKESKPAAADLHVKLPKPEIADFERFNTPNITADTSAQEETPTAPIRSGAESADEIFARVQKAAAAKTATAKKEDAPEFASPEFMEKLKGFLNDDEPEAAARPDDGSYTLASVDDILRSVENRVKQRTAEIKAEKLNNVEINYTDGAAEQPALEKAVDTAEKAAEEAKVTIFGENEAPVQIDVVHIDSADTDIESTRPVPLSFQYSFADEDLPNTEPTAAESEDMNGTMQFDLPDAENDFTAEAAAAARDSIKRSFRLEPVNEDEEDEDEEDYDDVYFADYSCTDDAPEIRRDLKKRCTTLLVRIIPTAVLTVLMGVLSLPVFTDITSPNGSLFRIISLAMLGLTMAVNYNIVLGIISLFKGQPDIDTPISIASIGILIYSAFGIMSADMLFLGAGVGMVMLAANIAKLMLEKRISADFERIANADSKIAVRLIDETQGSDDISRGAGLENALVCGSQRTVNITGFLAKCYAEQPYEKYIPAVLITGGALSLIVAAVSFALGSSIISAAGTLLTVFSVFCPAAYTLLSVLPFTLAASRVSDNGGLVCGLEGAENISDANAIVFNADQLFPAGTVNLYQMKILSPNPIDRAIVEAAAVATAAKSPLADMFCRMAEGRMDTVSDPVDSINLEGQMGISGWIKDRRILIGNRLLMETHGISIPPVNVDRNILERGFFPVYVACAGVPCALFVVGYNVDRRIKYELQRLCNTGTAILINSTDPNISEEMISDYFGIYRESVMLMNASSLNVYKNAVNYQESVAASGTYNGSASALACMLTTSVRLRSVIAVNIGINIALTALAALVCCYTVFTGGLPLFTPLALCAFNAISLGIGCLVPSIYRP